MNQQFPLTQDQINRTDLLTQALISRFLFSHSAGRKGQFSVSLIRDTREPSLCPFTPNSSFLTAKLCFASPASAPAG